MNILLTYSSVCYHFYNIKCKSRSLSVRWGDTVSRGEKWDLWCEFVFPLGQHLCHIVLIMSLRAKNWLELLMGLGDRHGQ